VFLHVASTVVDGYAPIGWVDAIVPFRSGYRPIWVGLGAVAFDLFLAVIITSLLRVRIGYSSWRWVHMLTYAMWPIALVHGLGTGSDTRSTWMWWVDGVCTFVVLASVAIRLHERAPVDFRLRRLALLAVITVPLLIAVWTLLGPMKANWQKKKPSAGLGMATVVFEDRAR
jgi:predicted ferric reductase